MTESRNRRFAKLAKDVDASGDITTDAIATDVSFGVDVYDSAELLPYVGNTAGDQAFVNSNNRLYIWQGSGWYSVALINSAPTISSVQDSNGNTTPFALSTEGAVTTITITAADSDGDPITYSAVADSDFNGLASISNSDNVFTITPLSEDSATTESGTITFKATDGTNIASSGVQTFTLDFAAAAFWDEAVLSIGMADSDGLDNSTFIDRSTNAHTVTPTGTPTQTAFHPYLDHWSVEFDGNDALTSEPSETITIGSGTDFCIEAWVYPTNLSAVNGGIFQAGTANSSLGFRHNTDGTLRVLANAVSSQLDTSSSLSNNQWHHIAATRSSGTLRIFIDGVQDASTSSSVDYTDPSASNDFVIGARYYSSAYQDEFYGYISNLRFVVGDAVYTSGFTPSTTSLTAITNTELLTCQSNRFLDNSSSSLDVTVGTGDPAISAFNPFGQRSEYTPGQNKGATYFDGSNDYLTESARAFNDPTTFEAWWYPQSTQDQTIFSTFSFPSGVELLYEGGSLRFQAAFGGTWNNTATSWSIPALYQWYHISAVYNGTSAKVFVNGEQVQDKTVAAGGIGSNQTLHIGARAGGSKITDGYLSDARIADTAVYTATFTPPTAPVGNTNASLYLPMDNAGIFDKTGNNTLTLGGNASTSTTQTKFADTSIYFDGSGDGAQFGDQTTLKYLHDKTSNYTIECWIYPTSVSGRRAILMTGAASASTGALLELSSSEVHYTIYRGVSGSFTTISGGTVTVNQWSHVAVTYDGTTIETFLNGTSIGSTAWSAAASSSSSQVVPSIGRDTASSAVGDFIGYIENFQILKGVAKYTSNFTVPSQEQGREYQAED